ncbi:MAG TPA: exodeoxyribonuclease III [Solirubrobacteraceae bacterium]|nr:exodeoxyribonuclease III [Solirubrobacteraceae bacterium]
MRLVTWNVNSLAARLPRVLELLSLHAPDVVCLQETKCALDAFPVGELRAAGYESVHHSGGRWAGVAILARAGTAVEEGPRGLPGEVRADEARWVEAVVDGVRIASTYVVNGRAVGSEWFEEKLAFLDAIVTRVAQLRGEPLIVAGDFNIAPEDRDVYDPAAFEGETHVTTQERSRLLRILDAGGLVDAYRAVHPDEQQFTWWDYRQGHFHRGLGLRIDLALVSEQLASGLAACGIDRNFRKGSKPSDHAPLLVDL